MDRDRIFTSSQYKMVVDDLKSKDVLGLDIVEGKEVFLLAVALGLNSPTDLPNKKGLFQLTALKTADKALFASALLGTLGDEDDIDAFANFDASADLCDACAESGYQVLLKKYNDAGGDEELLERRMLKELELLYTKNVENDL